MGRLRRLVPVLALSGALVTSFLVACGDSGGAGGSGGATSSTTSAATTSAQTATGGGGDTWTNFAQGWFATYCVGCHAAGNPTRDYTTLAGVTVDKAEIRCGVGAIIESGCTGFPPPKQFPVDNVAKDNPKPTDAERDRLVAWIDAGLPN